MSRRELRRHLDDLQLELQGLVLVRALLELRGFPADELARHDSRTRRVRAELDQLTAQAA